MGIVLPQSFTPACRPYLVGSLPLRDHEEAINRVMDYTPAIPSWVQLPFFSEERMVAQFLPGLPGVVTKEGKVFVDMESDSFQEELLSFYEEYLPIAEGAADLMASRFCLTNETAPGFFTFLKAAQYAQKTPLALKGQITGPITFTTAVVDQKGIPIFYDEQLRDAAVKLLTLKGRWQTRRLKELGVPVILSMDEPGLAGYGSSEFTSISREAASQCLGEVIEGIHAEGGIACIHVCANTDWSLILALPFDIINFDAYAYFDRFILYAKEVKRFLESGGILAWGIVPTLNPEDLQKETAESLAALLENEMERISNLGVDREALRRQSLITPACGMGSLSLDLMEKVLSVLKDISQVFRIDAF